VAGIPRQPRIRPGAEPDLRRGEVLELWATLDAANYRYVIRYGFADDGTIHIRAGGTAQNFRSVPVGNHEGIHLHPPTWRFEFDLGAANANKVEIVERRHEANSAAAHIVHREFANGLEGGEIWDPEKFSTLMVTNSNTQNGHSPPHDVSYKLVSLRAGSPRTHRERTKFDFWAVRVLPSSTVRLRDRERRFVEIADYIRNPEPLAGHAVALWYTTALHHVSRTEDFGASGYNAGEGVAINMWTGFDLMPHNLRASTPLYGR
jgi:Cu2+-containing amine oxidase